MVNLPILWGPRALLMILAIGMLVALRSEETLRRKHRDPFIQPMPDCSLQSQSLVKESKAKAILCPMIKDEIGFLSEWVAYYQMHGFDHIMIFDDGSTDKGLNELAPWIDSGFVSVNSDWTHESLNANPDILLDDFYNQTNAYKNLLESNCKKTAISWGYDFFVSLDIDEYLIPLKNGVTIVDGLENWFDASQRALHLIPKLNFQSAPHLLEPVHLLTIEAYRSRMREASQLNYYDQVSPKVALRLNGASFTSNTSLYLADCCHFHFCGPANLRANTFCSDNYFTEQYLILGNSSRKTPLPFVIHHYSRSVEKYGIKGKTWRLSSRDMKPNQTSYEASTSYDLYKFLARSTGMRYDDRALRYSCQLRKHLKNATGESIYFRPGTIWYRNPEFGRVITDPEKGRTRRHRKRGTSTSIL